MTHRLRTIHDGIMVGIGTVLVDNPQLNGNINMKPMSLLSLSFFLFLLARYLSAEETPIKQPQPIVLDPFLKLPTTCKLVQNYRDGRGKQPWLIVSERGCSERPERVIDLQSIGVKLIKIKEDDNGHIPLEKVFQVLKEQKIDTLMVEGGSKVIQSCLKSEWDQLIITVGPMFIGSDGVSAIVDAFLPELKNIKYEIMGKDCVMAATK
ncbi:MAG: riboflavin biosynthesis protein RibD domain-containing protein [Benjaminiella poitrasii]|nr:MAG: riboflavin biosynthesis protein RibD domain-containing protein [Benjaminiella poitrasii]